jgi:hypothetical protein
VWFYSVIFPRSHVHFTATLVNKTTLGYRSREMLLYDFFLLGNIGEEHRSATAM